MTTFSLRKITATAPVALVASAALVLTGCGADSEAAGDLELVAAGTLTVCSDIPYPPFEMEDSSSETGYSGFDMDVSKAIADGMELKLEVKDSSFDALQSGLALKSGDCDIAASAMTITEDRKKNLDFSDPYYDSKQSLLVAEGSDIKSIADTAGRKLGVQQGTTGESYAQENAAEAEIISFPGDAEMYQAIQAGQVDALLQDLPVNLEHTTDGKYTIAEEYSTDEQYGLAMKKGNDGLVSAINAQLKKLRDDGKYDEIYNKYFSEK